MSKGIEGLPKVRQAFARTYFDELKERVDGSNRLPTWEGELYFEYHRGTYTSMARNKRSNRKAELHMMDLELLGVLAEPKTAYPAAEIDGLWHGILINQFHDILPGSSIHEVYEVTKKEYAEMEAQIGRLEEERIKALAPGLERASPSSTPPASPERRGGAGPVLRRGPPGRGGPALSRPADGKGRGGLCGKSAVQGHEDL